MNIADVIMEIEHNDDPTERCISYCEIIVYLKTLRIACTLPIANTPWKSIINDQITSETHKSIDRQIEELKQMVDITVNNK